ncbi:hypothetical protein ACHAWC_010548 [Mediolabrus comicus]
MFRNTFQSGFLSILYSIGSKPLQIWDSKVQNGHIKRITDQDIQSSVLEIMGTNVSTSYIVAPNNPKQTLGIKLPFLVMIIKNLNKYFTFEVQVLDDKGVKRRFRASNYQSSTRVKPFICTMPMRLDEGWNQIQFNLSDFTRRAYGTNYVETLRVQIHANVRIRRIYFSDKLYTEDELPAEFKLFVPLPQQGQKALEVKKDDKDAAAVEKSVEKSVEKEKEKITKTIISEKTEEVGKKSETDASADEKENAGSSNLVM